MAAEAAVQCAPVPASASAPAPVNFATHPAVLQSNSPRLVFDDLAWLFDLWQSQSHGDEPNKMLITPGPADAVFSGRCS
jgi:hypothetical protein